MVKLATSKRLLAMLFITISSGAVCQDDANRSKPATEVNDSAGQNKDDVIDENWDPHKEGFQLLNVWFTGWGAIFFLPLGESPLNDKGYAVNPEFRSYPENSVVKLRVIPADGYRFEGWWVPDRGFSGKAKKSDLLPSTQLTLTMNRERYAWAIFVKNEERFDLTDLDGDGLSKYHEDMLKTDEHSADSDKDGLPDGWEANYKLNPMSNTGDDGSDGDPDHDGLSNAQEFANGTSPKIDEKVLIETLKQEAAEAARRPPE